MTYKDNRIELVIQQDTLTHGLNKFVTEYADGVIVVNASINGWVDISTERLRTTLYTSDGIAEMNISPKDCGNMTIDALIELKAQLKLEEKWIRQAYLAIRYYENQEHEEV